MIIELKCDYRCQSQVDEALRLVRESHDGELVTWVERGRVLYRLDCLPGVSKGITWKEREDVCEPTTRSERPAKIE